MDISILRQAITIIMTAVLAAIISCEGQQGSVGPEGPQGPGGEAGPNMPYVLGIVRFPSYYSTSGGYASVGVSNIHEIPTVTINNIPIPRYGDGANFADYDYPTAPSDSALLMITYDKMDGTSASGTAKIVMPGRFEIVSHDSSYTDSIYVGSDLTIIWSSSNNAKAYLCHIQLSYNYIDTLGNEKYFHLFQDTLVVDTSIYYPVIRFFPEIGEIDSMLYSSGYFYVESTSGPCLEGEVGNIQEDAIGFFNGRVLGGSLWIAIKN